VLRCWISPVASPQGMQARCTRPALYTTNTK
jgi:hypothetical protein